MQFDDNKKNILLLLLAVISIIFFLASTFIKFNKSDIANFKEEYEKYNGKIVGDRKYLDVDVSLNNKIYYVDDDNLLETMDNETGIFYFGFPNCPWCRNIVEILLSSAKKENIKVYYFNPRTAGSNSNELYNEVVKRLDKYLEKDEYGNKVLYVPDVYFIKNGKIVGHHLGSLDEQKDPFTELTSKQKEELKKIYLDLIKKVK